MYFSEHMEKLVADYLHSVELAFQTDEMEGIIKPNAEEATAMARKIKELLEPEVDALVKSAEKAGYNKGYIRNDPAARLGILAEPGDEDDSRRERV